MCHKNKQNKHLVMSIYHGVSGKGNRYYIIYISQIDSYHWQLLNEQISVCPAKCIIFINYMSEYM